MNKNNISRRNFLKGSAAFAASSAALLGTPGGASALGQTGQAAQSGQTVDSATAAPKAYYADLIWYDSRAHADCWLITHGAQVLGIAKEKPAGAEAVAFTNSAIFPSLINTHTHLPMSLFRGYADDKALHAWLNNYIWPAEQQWVSAEFVRDATLISAAEMIRSGSSCANDMYSFPGETAQVLDNAGLKGVIGVALLGENLEPRFKAAAALVEKYGDHPRIGVSICPHAVYTLSPDGYRQAADFARKHNILLHTHLSETAQEVADCLSRYGVRPVALLEKTGVFDCHAIFAHCVHLDDEEIAFMGRKKASVAHCVQSNLKLASGFAPMLRLMRAGANVTIGTDGAASNNRQNMLAEISAASLMQKALNDDPTAFSAVQTIGCATENAGKALLMPTSGVLKQGNSADFIVVSYDSVNMLPVYDHVSHLVYSANQNDITDVYVNGNALMKNRRLTTIDEEEVAETAKKWQKKIAAG